MYVHARVKTCAKEEVLTKKKENYFDISVREKAERNMANARVLEIIAKHFNIPKNKVRIVNGHQSPSKLIIVDSDVY